MLVNVAFREIEIEEYVSPSFVVLVTLTKPVPGMAMSQQARIPKTVMLRDWNQPHEA